MTDKRNYDDVNFSTLDYYKLMKHQKIIDVFDTPFGEVEKVIIMEVSNKTGKENNINRLHFPLWKTIEEYSIGSDDAIEWLNKQQFKNNDSEE